MWRFLSAYSTSYYTLVLWAVGICAILRWSGSITVGFCWLWEFRFFGVGAHVQGVPLGCWNLVNKCVIGGVSGNTRSAMVWMTSSGLCHIWRWCPVLSSDVPDVFLCIQMFLYHISIIICCVLSYHCVVDVFIFKIWLDYVIIMLIFSAKFTDKIMQPPLWHYFGTVYMCLLCADTLLCLNFTTCVVWDSFLMACLQPYLIRLC